MNPRIALAVLTAATILTLTAPADARRTIKSPAGATPVFDVAAAPAYPTAEMPGRAASRAASPSTKGLRMADHSRRSREASLRPSYEQSGSGIVRSKKTGATARVSPRYAAAFQAYVDDLESRGAAIYYMGGYRKGPCWVGGLHPCGKALDVCQDARDRVSGLKNCHLPGRAELARIAAAHGLFEGGQWCHGDMGHVQVGETAAPCRSNLYASVKKFKKHRIASRRGRPVGYERRRMDVLGRDRHRALRLPLRGGVRRTGPAGRPAELVDGPMREPVLWKGMR